MLYLNGPSHANILVPPSAQTVAGSSKEYAHRIRVLHAAHDTLVGTLACVLIAFMLRILENPRLSGHNLSTPTRAAFAHMNCASHCSSVVIGISRARTPGLVLRGVEDVAVISTCVEAMLPVASLASYFSTLIPYTKMKH